MLQADGGTRTASITGAYVALAQVCKHLEKKGKLKRNPLVTQVAAVSVGIVSGETMLDLCFEEDSRAGVDLNLVMTGDGRIVEVQGTAEDGAFTRQQMDSMVELGDAGIKALIAKQKAAIAKFSD